MSDTMPIYGPIPDGFDLVKDTVRHPRDGMLGALIRNRRTGVYAHLFGGVLRSVPRDWAAVSARSVLRA